MATENATTPATPTLSELRSTAWKLQAIITAAQEYTGRTDRQQMHLAQMLLGAAGDVADDLVSSIEQACEAGEVSHG